MARDNAINRFVSRWNGQSPLWTAGERFTDYRQKQPRYNIRIEVDLRAQKKSSVIWPWRHDR